MVVVVVMSQLCSFDCPIELPGLLTLSADHSPGHRSELPCPLSLSADHLQCADHWTDPWRMPGVPQSSQKSQLALKDQTIAPLNVYP